MNNEDRPTRWKILAAFAIIYLVWGSTFLAIRIGVHEVPPLLLAAMRFFTAGALLFGWLIVRGERSPTLQQWVSCTLLAALMFVCDYGLLFWAEQRVPSGIAAVMLATIPAFTCLSEIAVLRTQRLTIRLILALAIGIGGVAVLVSNAFNLGAAAIDFTGAAALIFAAVTWSIASVVSRKLVLPESKAMSSGAQMLSGGVMLTALSAALGEFRGFQFGAVSMQAWVALLYLIFAGSILGFTAYVWLLHHESPTRVGTYAYVNPVVAVILGYFLGNEALGMRTMIGTLCILVGVFLMTTAAKKPAVSAA